MKFPLISAVANELPGMDAEEHSSPELSVIKVVSTPLADKYEDKVPLEGRPKIT